MNLYDLAFYFAVFFLVGVALASVGFSALSALVATVLIGSTLLFLKPRSALIFLVPTLLLGFLYFNVQADAFHGERIPFDKPAVFKGMVSREPVYGVKSQKLTLELQDPHRVKIVAYLASYPRFSYGDLLELKGVIAKSPSGALNIMSFPEVRLLSKNRGNAVKGALFSFKRRFVSYLENVLPREHAALLAGETVGDRAGFSKQFTEAMNRSGTTHIVALSGHNISVVIFAVMFALRYFVSRRLAFYASIIFVLTFVVMTGAEASVVRAGIMGLLILLAVETDRLYSVRNALALTAFLMVLYDPRVLVFDIGFQLSFSALIGIVYLMPLLKHSFKVKDEGFLGWKYNALTTISAQLGVLPLLLYHFGYFSLLGILANILIIEAVPYTMGLGFLAGFAGFISDVLSLMAGWIVYPFLSYQIAVINFFAKTTFTSIYLNHLPLSALFGYYIFVAGGSWYLYKRLRLQIAL